MKVFLRVLGFMGVACFGLLLTPLFLRNCTGNHVGILGNVKLRPGKTSSLAAEIPRSWAEPWRLRFGSEQVTINDTAPKGTVEVYVRNDGAQSLVMAALPLVPHSITLQPGERGKIFEGTLAELLLAGRTTREELTLQSTSEREAKITLEFVCGSQNESLEAYAALWRIRYGM